MVKIKDNYNYLIAMDKQREKNKNIFFNICNEQNGKNIDLSKFVYRGRRIKGQCYCKICGHEWYDTPEQLIKKEMCPKCLKELKIQKLRLKKIEETKEIVLNKCNNKNYSDFNFFYDSNGIMKIKFYCHEKSYNGEEHGYQIQNVSNFLKKMTCGKCASHPNKAYDNHEWVWLAKNKYPEYDYTKTRYINKKTNVIITCKKHGDFSINPKDFLHGRSTCPQCTKDRLHDDFVNRVISKAKEVHGDEYIYHKELIYSSYEKIGIECRKHGIFWQNIYNHNNKGCKCPKCVNEIVGNKKRLKFNEIINRANNIHCNKYIYHEETYTNTTNKTLITCPIHGDFEQSMHSHLSGQGCPKCSLIKNGLSLRLTQEEFISRIKEIHKNENYNFSKTVYNGYDEKVIVICPKHGEFEIKASSLLNGSGCQLCKSPKLEKQVRNSLIENNINYKAQKRFKKWLGTQSLDFFLPDYNIAIECQGIQHFKTEKMYKNLEVVKERDQRKKRLCKENNIHLIYYVPPIFIKYMDENDIYFSDIEELIKYVKNFKNVN